MNKAVLLLAVLLVPVVYAQLDWSVTDMRCGNGVLDEFELCEDGIEESKCDELATVLEIDTACDDQHCTCLPRVNMAFCGNNKREGVELCDGDDKCPEYGQMINISLKCNKKTCGCDLNESIPADYSPSTVDELLNKTKTASVCGDKKIERDEDCDPPNTLCTTSSDDAGVCTENCKCEVPGMLEEPEATENVSVNVSENVTPEVNVSPVDVSENVTVQKEEEKKGFFSRLWAWIVALFS